MENELIRKLIKEEKSRKIFSKVFDNSTIQTLHFLANKGIFDKIEFVIKTGKEAYVFRAVDKSGNYKAVKIYKLEASDFKNMKDYIEGDIRFRGQKNTKRGIVFVWTQKEYKNLSVYKKAGVNVPLPIAFKNNVLVMEFIGEEGVASKSLKEKKTSNIEKFHRDILENMAKMVYKCKIVHADLSEYNILNKDDDFVIISEKALFQVSILMLLPTSIDKIAFPSRLVSKVFIIPTQFFIVKEVIIFFIFS